MKSRLLKKFIAYGFLPFMVVFFALGPLGISTAHAGPFDGLVQSLVDGSGTIVANLLVGLNMVFSALLFLVGQFLDFAIEYSIAPSVDSDGLGGLYRSDTVGIAWNLLRDIINMFFIFILLYVAIGTVLNIQKVDWKKQLAQIIIAAILVNFSLFITRVVVDAGNIVANGFYQELTVCDPPCTDSEGNTRDSVGISERFAGALGIPYFSQLGAGVPDTGSYEGWNGVATALMQIIVTLIAIWVFLSVAILFFARTVALIFILVLSPIGIAGSSIPLLGSFAQRWRQELFKQSLLGVVFLFFTFIILLFASLERDGVLTSSALVISDVNEELLPIRGPEGGPPAESLFIMYALVIAALIMSLRLTKSMSGQIGKFADGVGKGIVGVGLGVATGGTALLGRQTMGRAAQATLDSQRGKNIRAKAEEGDRVALGKYNMLKNTAGGSFDARTTKLGGLATKQASKLGGIAGLNASVAASAGKGGRTAQIKKTAEADAKSLAEFSPEGLRTYAAQSANRAERRPWSPAAGVNKERAKELRKMADRKETTKEERLKRVERAAGDIRSGDDKKVENAMSEMMSNELTLLPPDVLKSPQVISRLQPGDLEKLKGSVNRGTWNDIAASKHLLSEKAQAYLRNQEKEEMGE